MIVFATASGVSELLVARVVQGLATGAALGALGAGMIDISRERGTLANAVAPGIGTGLGALVSGIVVQYLPAPEHLIYLALLGVFALQAVGVLLLRETVIRTPGALATLVPDIKLPRATRGAGAGRRSGAHRGVVTGRVLRLARPGADPPADRLTVGRPGRAGAVPASRRRGLGDLRPAQHRAANGDVHRHHIPARRCRAEPSSRSARPRPSSSSAARPLPASGSAPGSRAASAPSCLWPPRTSGPASSPSSS